MIFHLLKSDIKTVGSTGDFNTFNDSVTYINNINDPSYDLEIILIETVNASITTSQAITIGFHCVIR